VLKLWLMGPDLLAKLGNILTFRHGQAYFGGTTGPLEAEGCCMWRDYSMEACRGNVVVFLVCVGLLYHDYNERPRKPGGGRVKREIDARLQMGKEPAFFRSFG